MKMINMTKRDGRVSMEVELDYLFSTLRNGRYTITVKRASEKRSVSQNDLLWMWMTCIEHETGTPKEDCYLYYCHRFLMTLVKVGARAAWANRTSSKLSVSEMSDFLKKIQADAATELGIVLPEPQDMYFDRFAEEYGD